MKETKVTCPVCGAEFEIANHEHIATGVVIGKDSNLGEIHPALAKRPNKADERLKALQAAGVDTTGLFAMQNASGEGMVVRVQDGIPTAVADDDPIFKALDEQGTIPERRLFRRWVMSQMFHMLNDRYSWERAPRGFTYRLKHKGYEYQWSMLIDELKTQTKLYDHDPECFVQRNRWFNKDVVVSMAEGYIARLREAISNTKVRHCKGAPYVRFNGRDTFVDDLNRKMYAPLFEAMEKIANAKTPRDLYFATCKFNARRERLPWGTKQSAAWVDAYKGAGAYFTLSNLILFHNCRAYAGEYFYGKQESMLFLERFAQVSSANGEGWKLLGYLKEFLQKNNVVIEDFFKKWAEQYDRKRNNR